MAISNPSLTQIKQALTEMLPKLKPLSVPTGMISAFNNVPEGWLQCNGAAVSRTTYAALFAVIGTKYGSGNGSTTFNLPNLHHKFIEGTTTSSEVGKSVAAGLPNITGSIKPFDVACADFTASGALSGGKSSTPWNGKTAVSSKTITDITFSASLSNSMYGAASDVHPASTRLIHCIKI